MKGLKSFTSLARHAGSAPTNVRRCVRIIQMLEVAAQPEEAKTPGMSISKTTIREEVMKRKNGLPPVHPGEIIKQDSLPSVGLSVTAAAKALGVSRQMLHDILAERKPLSAVMCLKMSRLFGSTPEFWMRLQATYDLKKAERNKKVMECVGRIVPVKPVEEVRA